MSVITTNNPNQALHLKVVAVEIERHHFLYYNCTSQCHG